MTCCWLHAFFHFFTVLATNADENDKEFIYQGDEREVIFTLRSLLLSFSYFQFYQQQTPDIYLLINSLLFFFLLTFYFYI